MKMSIHDVDTFIDLRMKLFYELGEINECTDILKLSSSTREYFTSHIGKDLFCWGILKNNNIISTASLCLFSRIPYLENLSGKEGYLLNIYTIPEYRKNGMAKELINTIIDYSKRNGIKRLWLNSSKQGESTYLECGFKEKSNEMELFCNQINE